MPCNDITEILKIKLDGDNRIVSYSLTKNTCGGGVGIGSAIEGWLKNRPAEEVLESSLNSFLEAHPIDSDQPEFFMRKNFEAVHNGLAVMLGYRSGTADDSCAVDTISYGPDGTELIARIRVSLETRNINSCGSCG